MSPKKITAVILAGGGGLRMGGNLKQFLRIAGQPLIFYSLNEFLKCRFIQEIILVVPKEKLNYAKKLILGRYQKYKKKIKFINGGKTRQLSTRNALLHLKNDKLPPHYVIFHDAARPLISASLVERVVKSTKFHSGAVLATQSIDLGLHVEKSIIRRTLHKEKTFWGQTPQCFEFHDILIAHQAAKATNNSVDNVDLLLKAFPTARIKLVLSTLPNFKVTYKHDIKLLESII